MVINVVFMTQAHTLTTIFFQGTYISSGMDLKEIEHHNFPKVYFYGRYQLMVKIKDVKNNVHGCCVLELSLLYDHGKNRFD